MGFRHQLGISTAEYAQLTAFILSAILAAIALLTESYSSGVTERINALVAVISV